MKALSDLDPPVKLNDCQLSHSSYVKAGQGTQKIKLLWIVLGLRIGLFLVELGVGLWSHSLSLVAGAGYLFSDLLALGLTLLAAWLAQRPAVGQATFGYQRLEILVALLNGLGLMAIAAWIAWQAIGRFQTPEPVFGIPMLIVAGLSLVINGFNAWLLQDDSHHDLNLGGAFLHVVADAASSVGVMLAALAIYYLNWLWADASASLLVACLLSLGAVPLVKDTLRDSDGIRSPLH